MVRLNFLNCMTMVTPWIWNNEWGNSRIVESGSHQTPTLGSCSFNTCNLGITTTQTTQVHTLDNENQGWMMEDPPLLL
jgi:hypothetical protein